MAFDRGKFKTLVHHICASVEDRSSLGAVKLNKICWLADFAQYYNTGSAITDVRYLKRQFGPVPAPMKPVLRELEAEGALVVRETGYHEYSKQEFISLSKPSLSAFDADELALIDRVVRFVCEQHTANSISELSHDHIWQAASDGEEIPYYTIFARPGELTESDREWARMELEC